jgi:hypothetical protein
MINLYVFYKYMRVNKAFVLVIAYFLFSIILNITFGIDICIPCLWKSVFGFHCPGCGITTAFISIMNLDFIKAIQSNWLIFIIIPFGTYYIIYDFIQFIEKQNKQTHITGVGGTKTIKKSR